MAAHLNAHKPAAASRGRRADAPRNETAVHFHAHAADAHHLKLPWTRAATSTARRCGALQPAVTSGRGGGCEACVELLLQRGAAPGPGPEEERGRTAPTRRPSPARRSARNYYWRRARTRTFVIPPALPPLHAAAFAGHAAVVEVLLERGADASTVEVRRDASTRRLPRPPRRGRALSRSTWPTTGPVAAAGRRRPPHGADPDGRFVFAAVAAGARRGREARRPIDAVVRDCQARLYPKDPRASAKPWAAAIASRHHGTPRRPPPERIKKPVNDQTARAKPLEDKPTINTRNWTSSNHGHAFGQTRCALCDPIAKDERGRRCNATHGTAQHAAWTDMRRAHLRRKRKEDKLARTRGRLAPGEVPWNPH